MPTTCELHRETTRTLPTEQVTTTPGRIHRSPTNPLWAAEFTFSWSGMLLPGVPSRGMGTVLLCGSLVAPGPSRHLLPCCCEAAGVRKTSSIRAHPSEDAVGTNPMSMTFTHMAWKRISGNIWTKKHWSDIGFPKWASAPMLVLITLGITGQLLSSLLTERHGKQSSKSKQRPFHHAEL